MSMSKILHQGKAHELRFGIIGCGMIGRVHAKAISRIEGITLAAVCDGSREYTAALEQQYGAKGFTDYDEMLREVDAVCICTPSGTHAQLAVRAARAGVHFITEKPMAIDIASADEVIAECEKNGVTGAVVSQLRFSRDIISTKQAVADGLIGNLTLVQLSMKYYRSEEYYASSKWRGTWALDGGGALMNQGIHGVDLMLHICGDAHAVGASVTTAVHKIEVEDTVVASLVFDSGARGTLCASTAIVPACNRLLELHGDRGSIILEEDSIKSWFIPDSDVAVSPVMESKHTTSHTPALTSEDGHVAQLTDFVRAIRTGTKPAVTLADGRRAVRLIREIYEIS